MGLVPQFEHPSPLGGQIGAGVQRAQGLVGDLETDTGDGHGRQLAPPNPNPCSTLNQGSVSYAGQNVEYSAEYSNPTVE